MIDMQYAHLVGDLMLAVIWLALILARRDLWREMVIVGSIMGGIAFSVGPLFFDYWKPLYMHPLGFEEFLYGFFSGGIASVIYEEVFGKRFAKRRDRHHHWPLIFLTVGLLSGLAFFYLLSIGILSIYASALLLVLGGSIALVFRHDLFADAVVSGTSFAFLSAMFFIAYTSIFPTVVEAWWNTEHLVMIPYVQYPFEEILWAFAFGFSAGSMYEFLAGLRFKK